MSAPSELLSFLRDLPFLGRATLSAERVVAGETTELQVVYEVGSGGLADGAWIKLVFKFYSDWALFQTSNPGAANYVSAEYLPRTTFRGESAATVRDLKVRFDQKGHERPYQKALIVDIVDGYLKPGDKILLRLGDRRYGGPGTRVQTFVESAFRFRVFVDNVGASRFAPVPGNLPLEIVSGPAARSVLLAPRVVSPGTAFPVTVRFEDRWGNLAEPESPPLHLDVLQEEGPRAKRHAPLSWQQSGRGWNTLQLTLAEPGDYSLEVGDARARVSVVRDLPSSRAFYADLHIHSEDTVGVNTTRDVMTYARDAAALDIAGYTANDFNVRADRWHEAVEVCRSLHHEGHFLCFPGTEWCGASAVGGDRNVIFLKDEVRFPLDRQGRSLRVFDWNEDTAVGRALQADVATAAGLHEAYRDLAASDSVLLIPHVGGRRALFEWHDPALERLVEVASSWGHFDWFYRDALSRGLKVGASAAGDEHRGRPGGGAPGVGSFGVPGGLTGVWTPELTSSAVATALRSRHTWATTGVRSAAVLRAGKYLQGDEFSAIGAVEVSYEAYAAEAWEWIEVRDGLSGEVLHHRNLHREKGYSAGRVRLRWGGARIKDRYRWAEWRLTLKIEGARVLNWTTQGFEHPEETATENAPGEFQLRTDTYGDADTLELELADLGNARFSLIFEIDAYNKTGDVLARNPDKFVPGGVWEIAGLELEEKGELRRDLGGAELFVALERLTEAPLPSVARATIAIPSPKEGKTSRAITLFAREKGDAKLWTSPLFLDYQ